MEKRTALVFGASGLTGSHLSKLLQEDDRYGKVKLFVRKQIPFSPNEKTEIHLVDFSDPEKFAHLFQSSTPSEKNQNLPSPVNECTIDLYCCLGTTFAKAGSREAFRNVDYHLPLKLAEIGQSRGVSSFIAVSSIGASENSLSFYLKTKGEMERDISKAMIEIANGNYQEKVFESDRVQEIADKRNITR